MKTHTTNYKDTFIEVADDCPVKNAEIPPEKASGRTVANIQFDIINKHPYKFTSDDVVFQVYAEKNEIPKSHLKQAREDFFAKGQPCLRASPLTKRYGWGVHSNEEEKIAIYAIETSEYKKMAGDKSIQHFKAMRSKKA